MELRRRIGIVDAPYLNSDREEQAILARILVEPVNGASVFFIDIFENPDHDARIVSRSIRNDFAEMVVIGSSQLVLDDDFAICPFLFGKDVNTVLTSARLLLKPLQPIPISPDVAQKFAEPKQTAPVVAPVVTAAQSRANRIDYAETYEGLLLKAGMDATVRTEGKNADTLVITYVLVDRPLVYNMINDSDTMAVWRTFGFKKVRFSDGYEKSWTQSLE